MNIALFLFSVLTPSRTLIGCLLALVQSSRAPGTHAFMNILYFVASFALWTAYSDRFSFSFFFGKVLFPPHTCLVFFDSLLLFGHVFYFFISLSILYLYIFKRFKHTLPIIPFTFNYASCYFLLISCFFKVWIVSLALAYLCRVCVPGLSVREFSLVSDRQAPRVSPPLGLFFFISRFACPGPCGEPASTPCSCVRASRGYESSGETFLSPAPEPRARQKVF